MLPVYIINVRREDGNVVFVSLISCAKETVAESCNF